MTEQENIETLEKEKSSKEEKTDKKEDGNGKDKNTK